MAMMVRGGGTMMEKSRRRIRKMWIQQRNGDGGRKGFGVLSTWIVGNPDPGTLDCSRGFLHEFVGRRHTSRCQFRRKSLSIDVFVWVICLCGMSCRRQ